MIPALHPRWGPPSRSLSACFPCAPVHTVGVSAPSGDPGPPAAGAGRQVRRAGHRLCQPARGGPRRARCPCPRSCARPAPGLLRSPTRPPAEDLVPVEPLLGRCSRPAAPAGPRTPWPWVPSWNILPLLARADKAGFLDVCVFSLKFPLESTPTRLFSPTLPRSSSAEKSDGPHRAGVRRLRTRVCPSAQDRRLRSSRGLWVSVFSSNWPPGLPAGSSRCSVFLSANGGSPWTSPRAGSLTAGRQTPFAQVLGRRLKFTLRNPGLSLGSPRVAAGGSSLLKDTQGPGLWGSMVPSLLLCAISQSIRDLSPSLGSSAATPAKATQLGHMG